ncbi:MAG: hypothetical protein ACFBZ9_01275 [Sphingomonadales bacterium]
MTPTDLRKAYERAQRGVAAAQESMGQLVASRTGGPTAEDGAFFAVSYAYEEMKLVADQAIKQLEGRG